MILSMIALVVSITVAISVYIKIKSVYINLYELSKGLDVLFANQEKILELTKVKSFVQLVKNEENAIKTEVIQEKTKFGDNKVQISI